MQTRTQTSRIVYYAPGPSGFLYDWHRYHMPAELASRGFEVEYCNPFDVVGNGASAAECGQVLVDRVSRVLEDGGPVDLVMSVAADETIDAAAIQEIRRRGMLTVNLSTDDFVIPYRNKQIAKAFDLTWTTVPAAVELLRSYGGAVEFLPWAANPFVFRPVVAPEARVVGFLGRSYGVRAIRIAQLAGAGISVVRFDGACRPEVVGRTPLTRALAHVGSTAAHVARSLTFPSGRRCIWSAIKRSALEFRQKPAASSLPAMVTWTPAPSFEEVSGAYANMALSLGSSEVGSTYVLKRPLLFPRLREFEAPMCGAVHLVNRSEDLQACFEEDREMLFYDTAEEMIEKARFYLDPRRDTVRHAIRTAARRRAEHEHTWYHRYLTLRKRLGLRTAA